MGEIQNLGFILFVFLCFVPEVLLLNTCWEWCVFFSYLLLVVLPNSLRIPYWMEFLALS